MIHVYRRSGKRSDGAPLMPIEWKVPPGHPHGDAWGRVMGHPESHDVERYLAVMAEKRKKEKK